MRCSTSLPGEAPRLCRGMVAEFVFLVQRLVRVGDTADPYCSLLILGDFLFQWLRCVDLYVYKIAPRFIASREPLHERGAAVRASVFASDVGSIT